MFYQQAKRNTSNLVSHWKKAIRISDHILPSSPVHHGWTPRAPQPHLRALDVSRLGAGIDNAVVTDLPSLPQTARRPLQRNARTGSCKCSQNSTSMHLDSSIRIFNANMDIDQDPGTLMKIKIDVNGCSCHQLWHRFWSIPEHIYFWAVRNIGQVSFIFCDHPSTCSAYRIGLYTVWIWRAWWAWHFRTLPSKPSDLQKSLQTWWENHVFCPSSPRSAGP